MALLEGGGNSASVQVSGDVGGFAHAEVLSGHAAGGSGGKGVAEEGDEGGIAVVVGKGDGGGREGRGFEVGFGREAGGAVVGAGLVAGDAAEGVVEDFSSGGIARRWGWGLFAIFGEAGEVSGDGFDGVGVGFFVASEEAGHLGAGFAVLRAADESPEGIDVEPGADTGEVGAGFGTDEGIPRGRGGMAGGTIEFSQEEKAALGEEGVVVFWEVKLVEGIDVGMVQRGCLEGVRRGGGAEEKEQRQREKGKKSVANEG